MKKLSDSDLQSMLRQKMLNYEEDVPEQTDEQALAHLNRLAVREHAGNALVKYALLIVLIIIPAGYFTIGYNSTYTPSSTPRSSSTPSLANASTFPASDLHFPMVTPRPADKSTIVHPDDTSPAVSSAERTAAAQHTAEMNDIDDLQKINYLVSGSEPFDRRNIADTVSPLSPLDATEPPRTSTSDNKDRAATTAKQIIAFYRDPIALSAGNFTTDTYFVADRGVFYPGHTVVWGRTMSNKMFKISEGLKSNIPHADQYSIGTLTPKEKKHNKDSAVSLCRDIVENNKEKESDEKETGHPIYFTPGVTHFLSYKHIRPDRYDGVNLDDFSGPAALSPTRMGFRISAAGEYGIGRNRFIAFGLAYTHYKTSFTYASNEITDIIQRTNIVNEKVRAIGIFTAIRYPVVTRASRKQYISAGIDGQILIPKNGHHNNGNIYAVNFGYATDFSMSRGILRITPTANYSLTHFQYSGVSVQPFWMGIEVAWSVKLRE